VHASYTRDRYQSVFTRGRIGAALRFRHRPENVSWGRVRIGYREQNDATFEGFDQSEFRTEIGHDWRPFKDRTFLNATLFGERRDADADRFSYTEYGVRFLVRRPVSDAVELSSRLLAYDRSYDDEFSSTFPIRRQDRRIRATLQADHALTDTASVFAYGGWDNNASNISARAYEGLIFGFGVRVSGVFDSPQN